MAEKLETGRIVRSLSGFYDVVLPDGTLTCKARGILRKQGLSPLTGDMAAVTRQGEKGMVEQILPRKNSFVRPAVANVDALVIFAANVNPVTEPFLIDRVTAIAGNKGVESILCVNKTDLDRAEELVRVYTHAGFRVISTSAETGAGLEELRESSPPSRATPAWARAAFSIGSAPTWPCPRERFPKSWAVAAIPPGMWSSSHWMRRPSSWILRAFPPLIRTRWILY